MPTTIRADYPPGVKLRPLLVWPGPMTPLKDRRRSAFASTFSDTMTLLERELRMYDRRDGDYPSTVLQLAIGENDLRNDGMPRATAKLKHSGVIVSVESKHKPRITLPCDTFTEWGDNLRAIALTLEALRKIERYGVTRNDEQYRGWQALPAGSSSIAMGAGSESTMSPDAAVKVILDAIGLKPRVGDRFDKEKLATMIRAAKREAHPDRNLGATALWEKVEQAERVLKKHGWA